MVKLGSCDFYMDVVVAKWHALRVAGDHEAAAATTTEVATANEIISRLMAMIPTDTPCTDNETETIADDG